jgi:SAM-dependent methyltransferase
MTQSNDPHSTAGAGLVLCCPYCGGERNATISSKDYVCSGQRRWDYNRCGDCGAFWLTTVPIDLSPWYSGDYYTHSPAVLRGRIRPIVVKAALAAGYGFPAGGMARCLSKILRFIPIDTGASRFLRHIENGRVLDVGCGSGDFLALLQSHGWEVHGIDPDPVAVRLCTSRGISATQSDAESATLPHNHFDAITLHHSLEHMRNLEAVITRLACALKPTGTLVIITPNADGFPARHFGPYWRSLDPPRHTALATPRALRIALRRAGLKVDIRTTSRNAGWVCRASLALKCGASLGFQPSRWAVLRLTLMSKIAAVFDPARGEEMICIARKAHFGCRIQETTDLRVNIGE